MINLFHYKCKFFKMCLQIVIAKFATNRSLVFPEYLEEKNQQKGIIIFVDPW